MSLHDLIGEQNAAANQLRYNDLYQTGNPITTRAGIGSLGFHAYLSVGNSYVNSYFNTAWREYIDANYGAMQQFTSYTARYTKKQFAAYLHYCAFCDWLIAEGTRDLNMLNWDCSWDATAKTDYWGPNQETVMTTHLPNRPYRITKAMNIIASYARQYPHVVTPWQKTVEYLIANIFVDDQNKRTNYLYYHLFNDTMQASVPNPYRCFDLLEAISNITAQAWTIDGTSFTNPFYSVFPPTDNALGNIRADLAKVFPADLTYPQYEFLSPDQMVSPVFDPVVCHAMNQGQYGSMIFSAVTSMVQAPSSTSPGTAGGLEPSFYRRTWYPADDANLPAAVLAVLQMDQLGAAASAADLVAPQVLTAQYWDMVISPSGAAQAAKDAVNSMIDNVVNLVLRGGQYLFPYYGPTFEGVPVLEGLIFDQAVGDQYYSNPAEGTSTTGRQVAEAMCSQYGITIAQTWNNTINTTGVPAINYMFSRVLAAGLAVSPGPARFVAPAGVRTANLWLNVENARETALNTDAFSVWNYVYNEGTFDNPRRISVVSIEDIDEFTLFNMNEEAVIASSVMRGLFGNSIRVPATKRGDTLSEEKLGYSKKSQGRWKNKSRNRGKKQAASEDMSDDQS